MTQFYYISKKKLKSNSYLNFIKKNKKNRQSSEMDLNYITIKHYLIIILDIILLKYI